MHVSIFYLAHIPLNKFPPKPFQLTTLTAKKRTTATAVYPKMHIVIFVPIWFTLQHLKDDKDVLIFAAHTFDSLNYQQRSTSYVQLHRMLADKCFKIIPKILFSFGRNHMIGSTSSQHPSKKSPLTCQCDFVNCTRRSGVGKILIHNYCIKAVVRSAPPFIIVCLSGFIVAILHFFPLLRPTLCISHFPPSLPFRLLFAYNAFRSSILWHAKALWTKAYLIVCRSCTYPANKIPCEN